MPLSPLPIYLFRVSISLASPLAIDPARRAILWRGAFGAVLRSLVCHDPAQPCDPCPMAHACPFARIFTPTIPANRPRIARLSTPPRPFILTDPLPDSSALPASHSLPLGLTLVGSVADLLPYFVVALRRLGELGLGRRKTRYLVQSVTALDAYDLPAGSVFEVGRSEVRSCLLPLRAPQLLRPGDSAARKVEIAFRTPTLLRSADASVTDAPSFATLICRCRDRISALATLFGDQPLTFDARQLAQTASAVRLFHAELRSTAVSRRSSRTGDRHLVGGLLGTVVYEGPIGPFMPWLRVAERVGIGRHATFGNGRVAVRVLA